MANFFAELKRRHIYRVAAAYAVVAWVLVQLVDDLAPIFELPPWIARAVVLLLILGFPITLLIAWMSELAPADGSAPRAATGKLDWFLAAALVVVIALVSYGQFAPAPGASIAQTQQKGVAAERATAASPASAISIAVLPFTNMSGDSGQEFFSDGMTEEITAALAKVPDLRVVARTSAFEFKGQNKDMQLIGRALRATHLIEGSVRKAGDRVRITVQLIKADDGTHIWSENYDRQLTDIFATQEDIARAITTSLRMPLGLKPGENLVNNRSIDPESYQQYLRAKALRASRGGGAGGGSRALTEAAGLLEQIVAKYPNYAPAWVELAQTDRNLPTYLPGLRRGEPDKARQAVQALQNKAELAARKAIQLDPNLAGGYASLGSVLYQGGKLLQAEEPLSRALALDPNDPEALQGQRNLLASVGRLKEALALTEQLHTVEPFVPILNQISADIMWLNGQNDDAIAMFKALNGRQTRIARMYAAMGRYGEAADVLMTIPSGSYPPGALEQVVGLLRKAPATAASPQNIPRLGGLNWVYLYTAAPALVLEPYEENVKAGYFLDAQTMLLWHPSFAPVRKTERFKAYVRSAGMVEYWRAKGWPDLCRPMGTDDFACN